MYSFILQYFDAMILFCLLFWIPNFVLPATTKKEKKSVDPLRFLQTMTMMAMMNLTRRNHLQRSRKIGNPLHLPVRYTYIYIYTVMNFLKHFVSFFLFQPK